MIANIINQTLFGFRYSPENCKPLFDFVNAFTFVRILSWRMLEKRIPFLSAHRNGSFQSSHSFFRLHTSLHHVHSIHEGIVPKSYRQ